MSRLAARMPDAIKGKLHAKKFLGDRCVLSPTLVVPIMVLWREYQKYAAERRFPPSAAALRAVLEEASWAEVIDRPESPGRLKSVVKGVGMKAS